MNIQNYDITNDQAFKQFLRAKSKNSPKTKKIYKIFLNEFCNFTEKTLTELLNLFELEQNSKIENNIIITPNINRSVMNNYLYDFRDFLKTEKKNKNTSINFKINTIKSIFKFFGLQIPKIDDLIDDSEEWSLLTIKDIKEVLDNTSKDTGTLIKFLAVTGLRITDVCNLKIKDFIIATNEYHEYTELDDFLNYAPDNMMGFWELIPQKTKDYKIEVITGTTPEVNNELLFMLRKRKKFLEKKGVKLTKNNYLFTSRQNPAGIEPRKQKNVSQVFLGLKKRFIENKTKALKLKLKDGLISEETYDDEIVNIPKFHAHGLRKFFISTLANNSSNLRINLLMEGHKSNIKTDKNYIKLDKELIKETYINLIPFMTFDDKYKIDDLIANRTEELLKENYKLKKDNERIKFLEGQFNKMNTFLDKIESLE